MFPLICALSACTSEDVGICAEVDDTTITVGSLLEEMSSTEVFTRKAVRPFRTKLASSFDRGSLDGNWFANNDRGFYQEEDGDEFVMLDTEGPGVVTRIWSANPEGRIRIYIDGSEEPVIDANMEKLLQGDAGQFDKGFSLTGARGRSFYFPIPFAKRCRVTATAPELYYHVTYRSYDESVPVQSFSKACAKSAEEAQNNTLAYLSGAEAPTSDTANTAESATIDTEGGALEINHAGGKVDELRVETSGLSDEQLRRTLLVVRVDGETAVDAPLGDFFGGGPGIRAYQSLFATVEENGTLISRWPMPFGESLSLTLEDTGAGTVSVPVEVHWSEYAWDDSSYVFRAHRRGPASIDVVGDNRALLPSDWNLATIEGEGLYVGTILNVANPSDTWWGEGDEKIFVDDEDFPSSFGTGTEDYFGYAWCSTELFSQPLVGQTRASQENNSGLITNYRWHLLDAIPFQQSLTFDLEVLHWEDSSTVSVEYDAVVFWYGKPGAVDTGEGTSPELPSLDLQDNIEASSPYACGPQ